MVLFPSAAQSWFAEHIGPPPLPPAPPEPPASPPVPPPPIDVLHPALASTMASAPRSAPRDHRPLHVWLMGADRRSPVDESQAALTAEPGVSARSRRGARARP